MQVRLGTRGRVTVPREVRERLGLRPGDALLVLVEGGSIVLRRRSEGYTDPLWGLKSAHWADADQVPKREG